MATTEDVQKLAALARIKIEDSELEKFTKEFDAVLAYVGQIESLNLPEDLSVETPRLHNVMRPDVLTHTPGSCTEKIVAQFPARERNALSVKQIISND